MNLTLLKIYIQLNCITKIFEWLVDSLGMEWIHGFLFIFHFEGLRFDSYVPFMVASHFRLINRVIMTLKINVNII